MASILLRQGAAAMLALMSSAARAEQPSFTLWAATYRPAGYATAEERVERELIFLANSRQIEHVNALEEAKNGPLRLEVNRWADLSFDEWKHLTVGRGLGTDACASQSGDKRHPDLQAVLDSGVPLADEVDWRDPSKNPAKVNAVTPAKNQGGNFPHCTAFAAEILGSNNFHGWPLGARVRGSQAVAAAGLSVPLAAWKERTL